MLKEIINSIESYFKAHRFIQRHRLWLWILIPGLIYMLMFMTGMYYFWKSSDDAISYISHLIGIDSWLRTVENRFINFLFIMGEMMIRVIMVFFYFSLFKYLFLIIGSPLFAYLSEKTESIISGEKFKFSFRQFRSDIVRGVKLSFRNTLWQTVYLIFLVICSFVPLLGWITPLISLFVECFYYGFSMYDYSCERHKLTASQSIVFINRHKGLAIGNGMIFYLMHLIPFLGWVLAPSYSVVAATISLYELEEKNR